MMASRSRRSRSIVTKSAGARNTSAPVPGAPVALRPLAIAAAIGARRELKLVTIRDALIDRLQQMHVNASAGRRRILSHRLQQRPGAPLHAGGVELHVDLWTGDGGRDSIGQFDDGPLRNPDQLRRWAPAPPATYEVSHI